MSYSALIAAISLCSVSQSEMDLAAASISEDYSVSADSALSYWI